MVLVRCCGEVDRRFTRAVRWYCGRLGVVFGWRGCHEVFVRDVAQGA